ncbi:MAG: peptidoglycan bridge formation glycyltransferase FemA/FemB family protein [Deltaproteobacteria bacterium]|nr:MAG: peptidoglycan bridge formation glycyltransferase FemA/FemB family protein [Deltaproteobacteria bacterium]
MLKWHLTKDTKIDWDQSLMQFPDYTIYQSYSWGVYRSQFGWVPYRLIAKKNEQIVAMAQVLVRKFRFGVALAWVLGGPIGNIESWNESFWDALKEAIGVKYLYCRINPMREQGNEDMNFLKSAGWSRPRSPILTGLSAFYSLVKDEKCREENASRNWRHNLRRSLKYGNTTEVWQNPNPDEMMDLYSAMEAHKNLPEQFSHSSLKAILEIFGKDCLVIRCNDSEGKLLALRGALLMGYKAWDIFAAASPAARKVYASHATFWELMRRCSEQGIRWYDMSGIDPINNKGVFDFKKGTGAEILSYLGEWDRSTSAPLNYAANYLIKRRIKNI